MKKYIVLSLSILLFSACGGSSDDPAPTPTPPAAVNNAPTVPSLIDPVDGLKCTDNPLEFAWSTSSDPDGDAVSYYIQVATNNSFSEGLQVKSTSSTTASFTLIKGVAYYWRTNSKDSKNKSSAYSPTRKFYSEGDGVSNHLPYAPALISPVLNASLSETSTILTWSSSDADGDPLKYDVYFGTSNPPLLVVENTDDTTHSVNLDADTIYYWKIVAKDDAGGETIGQVWSFYAQ